MDWITVLLKRYSRGLGCLFIEPEKLLCSAKCSAVLPAVAHVSLPWCVHARVLMWVGALVCVCVCVCVCACLCMRARVHVCVLYCCSHTSLRSRHSAVLVDSKRSQVYVWHGKSSSKTVKARAYEAANQTCI